ncbi:MAG: hypothetical protein O7B25_04655 [Gammaproteobacteria bacterium]|nr:hypothetical protein [Gammaproteobacteria bacterium]
MQTLRSVLGIIFKRQSPERLHYSKQRLISAIIAAIAIAIASHTQFFEMSLNAALLKLVFELGVLVVGLRLAWAMSTARRRRLLKMTLALFLISALGDAALTALSVIPLDSQLGLPRQLLAVSIMLAQIIGAVNSVRFGISVNWRMAAAYVLGYVIVSMLLADLAGGFLQ